MGKSLLALGRLASVLLLLLLLLASVSCTGCVGNLRIDGGGPGNDAASDAGLAGATLEISPTTATLTVVDGVAATQPFTALVRYLDGSTEDVTATAIFSISNTQLGNFAGPLFSALGTAGGEGTAIASYMGLDAPATVTVLVNSARVDPAAPPNAPALFGTATDDPGLAPAIVYPSDTTMVPPNLGDFEVHWTDIAGADLFEVALVSDFVDLRVYVTGAPLGGSWTAFLPTEWAVAHLSARGEIITITVRGMVAAAPATAGTSSAISVELTDQDVLGGIYYWAAASVSGAPAGIYRHDMDLPGDPAEAFYTTVETPAGRCVACHVLSRDGTRMAVTYDGGNGAASILDVATRTPLLPTDGTFLWNFATFEPDGSRILTAYSGTLTLREPATGADLGTVPTAGYATHPDFSPSGDAIAYIAPASASYDWVFTGGRLVTQSFDPISGTFGAPVDLVPAGPENIYYPAWSPDGQWLLFNKSVEDSYDDGTAELWIVRADGTTPPFKLDSPNVGSALTNSWARWAPFEQTLGVGIDGEVFFWLTFSSKRAFGVRLAGGRPQVWMAPFFPARAMAGMEPSAPAFRLPFQDLDTSNHIAQWTETTVPIE